MLIAGPAQLLRSAEAMSPKWHAFFFVALRTGMRKGEIQGLHWREVDFDRRRITVLDHDDRALRSHR